MGDEGEERGVRFFLTRIFNRGLKLSFINHARTLTVNFFEMPVALRFLTGMSLLYLFFIGASIVPGTVNVHGKIVTTAEWWANKSGFILLFASIPLITSGFLLLRRAAHARPLYIVGWVAVDIAAIWIPAVNDVPLSRSNVIVYGVLSAVSIIAFATYLYLSGAVKTYLNDTLPASTEQGR
ncbi:hypothetical protein [Luteibacter mycovicinus]|nr:hypothetical protein [Luteibacter sp. 9143a]